MGGHYYEKQKQKHKTAISVHVILQMNIVDFLEVYDDGHIQYTTIINPTVICTLTSKS